MIYKSLITGLIFLYSSLYGTKEIEEFDESNFFYLKVDNCMNLNTVHGVFSPFVGIGERQVFGKNATDINFGVELEPILKSKFKVVSWNVNCNYLRFLKAVRKNKYYIGTGFSLRAFYTPDISIFLKGPSFIFGKQIYERRNIYIVEMKINWPNHESILVNGLAYHIGKSERLKRIWASQVFVTTGWGF